ncbi:MAG: trimethylamine methyltransferase family protein [Aquamicrobium sp.]|uniref:trimethylamine methyltransferase family protein n=1 Tax=Aquamicrobium sp. TaxID=1872579 RepID=UPI00349EDD15|nr:trimethylamine methyltransferase family protein [Aquamicrobium sp.]
MPLAADEDHAPAGPAAGRYRALSEAGIRRVHETALDLLETVGFANAPPSCAAVLARAGAIAGGDGRLRFPRALVLDTIARAAPHFTLHGQDPRHDLALQGGRPHFGTAGAAVHLVDLEARDYRESRLADIYDAARLVDALANIHFFQRPMVARDMVDPADLDLNTLYACIAGTTKHVGTSFTVRENVAPALDLLHTVAGGEKKFRARPFVSNSNPLIASPLKFAANACGVLESCVDGGLPVLVLSAGQAGTSAPPALAGALVQAVAETLAGLVYVNALRPGHPCILGLFPFACDPRTGAMAGGSAGQALLAAACGQMAAFYDLPGGSVAGMADAKLPDVQSGYEKGITEAMAALAGVSLVYEAAGMHAALGGFCLESLVIDNDMIGECLRCAEGIEVSDETLSFETIARTCTRGPGHYLGEDRPGAANEAARQPAFADRLGVKDWQEAGRPDMLQRAIAEKRRILAHRFPRHIPRALDDALRARHPNILLPREAMGW